MTARPFHPTMGRHRRQSPWWLDALTFIAVLVCGAWAGAHGLGTVVGAFIAAAALVAIAVAMVVGGSWFAGWVVREIRGELAAARLGGQIGDAPLAPAERQRRYRARLQEGQARGRFDEQLAVQCWCRAEIVHVDPAVVRAGLTESCGRARCDQLKQEATR